MWSNCGALCLHWPISSCTHLENSTAAASSYSQETESSEYLDVRFYGYLKAEIRILATTVFYLIRIHPYVLKASEKAETVLYV